MEFFHSLLESFMIRALLVTLLLLFQTVVLFSATAKVEECPDPNCCVGTRGLLSCYMDIEPCWKKCSRVCPCGTAVYCSMIERYWPICQIGEPGPGREACYQKDVTCDEFMSAFDACNDPCCWDPDLQNVVCDPVCNGRD